MKLANPKYQVKNRFSSFETIAEILKKIGWNMGKALFVPVSGLKQYNISEKYYEWYKGPTLLEAMNSIAFARKKSGPFRLAVLVNGLEMLLNI